MRVVNWLFGRKSKTGRMGGGYRGSQSDLIRETKAAIEAVAMGEGPAGGRFAKLVDASPELLTRTATSAVVIKEGPTPVVNIWDLDPAPARGVLILDHPVQDSRPAQRPEAPRATSRTRTRVLGFEQPTAVVPLFGEGRMEVGKSTTDGSPGVKAPMAMFPIGWLIVTEGPGRGAAFALSSGVSHIGRGSDQTVALDFGDMAISRVNHAAVSYDAATHRLRIGHGGKSNLVRLNGKPLLATETLADGDQIQIGETTLLLKVLCTAAFNWSQGDAEGDGNDMAIA